jgi:hypothetical protein
MVNRSSNSSGVLAIASNANACSGGSGSVSVPAAGASVAGTSGLATSGFAAGAGWVSDFAAPGRSRITWVACGG